MGVVKLPSGKTAKVPDGLTEQEVLELLWEKLPDGADKDAIGDKLNTSGWGSTIGGLIGGALGTVGGSLVAPVAGTIAGGAAGGAAGAAAGEALEQWWTGGRGDLTDVGTSAVTGGVVGGIGGGALGAATKFGAKGAAAYGAGVGAAPGVKEGDAGSALVGAATGAVTGGVGGGLLGKATDVVSRKLGLDKPMKKAADAGIDFAKNKGEALFLKLTGRGAAAGLQNAATNWQAKRDLINIAYNAGKKFFLKDKRRNKLTAAEEKQLREASKLKVEEIVKQRKADLREDKAIKEKFIKQDQLSDPREIQGVPGGGYVDEVGNTFDASGKHVGKHYALGGTVKKNMGEGLLTRMRKA